MNSTSVIDGNIKSVDHTFSSTSNVDGIDLLPSQLEVASNYKLFVNLIVSSLFN